MAGYRRLERTDRDRLLDSAVLLYLWAGAQSRAGDAAGDRLKLAKLAFLAANDLYWNRIKAVNLSFFRYQFGPFSRDLYANWDELTAAGHLVEEEQFRVTEQGQNLARQFGEQVLGAEPNAEIRHRLDCLLDTYAPLSTEALLDRVYKMRCRALDLPGLHTVRDLPMYTDLTGVLDASEAGLVLAVSPGWEVSLELAFHPDALANLQTGIEDARQGRVFGWEALGGAV